MLPLTKEELKPPQDAILCCICGKRVLEKLSNTINYPAAHSICNLKFTLSNETPVVFHNGSNYCHIITKKLANEFEGKLEFLVENSEKYKTYSAPIEKEVTEIDKDGNESVVTIS